MTPEQMGRAGGPTLSQIDQMRAEQLRMGGDPGLSIAQRQPRVSDEQIKAFVSQNMGNPQAIMQAMKQYGVSPRDISRATGYSPEQVQGYFRQAEVSGQLGQPRPGNALEPRNQLTPLTQSQMQDRAAMDGARVGAGGRPAPQPPQGMGAAQQMTMAQMDAERLKQAQAQGNQFAQPTIKPVAPGGGMQAGPGMQPGRPPMNQLQGQMRRPQHMGMKPKPQSQMGQPQPVQPMQGAPKAKPAGWA